MGNETSILARPTTRRSVEPASPGPPPGSAPLARRTRVLPGIAERRERPFALAETLDITPERVRERRRWLGKLAFLLVVLVPTLASTYYYLAMASPQYESEFRFGVRSADAVRNDATSIFQGMAAASQIGLDSYVVVQYIQSREMVDALRPRFDFQKLFGASSIDAISRLTPDAASEDVVDYWRAHVLPFFDLTTGSVTVRVRAFAPEDAKQLAEAIIVHAEALVNEMSAKARQDAVMTAQGEVERAETRLRSVLDNVRDFREQHGRLNPDKEAESGLKRMETIREQLTQLRAVLAVQRSYMSEGAPAVKATKIRIQALETQVKRVHETLTSNEGAGADGGAEEPLTRDMGAFDALEVEQKFAEENYRTALTSLEKARVQGDRQMSYLSAFVRPSLAEASTYPKQWQSIAITFAVCLGIWILGSLMVKSVRERA
jgi:capsular polysaccharide transport system permease protein